MARDTLASMATKKTTTDDVMRLQRGDVDLAFSYEEWTCVRFMWVHTAQRSLPLVPMLGSPNDGALDSAGVAALLAMVEQSALLLMDRELSESMRHGQAAGLELFELFKAAASTRHRQQRRHQGRQQAPGRERRERCSARDQAAQRAGLQECARKARQARRGEGRSAATLRGARPDLSRATSLIGGHVLEW